ncbi:MAG: hypothetical protein WHS89_12305 [Acidimicrobiales bacterium]
MTSRGWDAFYVALAEVLDARLLTLDERLARARLQVRRRGDPDRVTAMDRSPIRDRAAGDDATARWLDAFARRYLHLPPDP